MDGARIEKFYDDIGFTGTRWKAVEEAVEKRLAEAMDAWRVARGAEAEAYLPVLPLSPPRGYRDAYIDLHILANTVLIRYVKRRYTRLEDIEHYVLVIGELAAEPPGIGGHGSSRVPTGIRVEWYTDIVEYLEVTMEEAREYERLAAENADRVAAVLSRAGETGAAYLVILKAWEEKTLLRSIDRIVGVYVEEGRPYLVYMEDHRSGNDETVYLFRMARLIVGMA